LRLRAILMALLVSGVASVCAGSSRADSERMKLADLNVVENDLSVFIPGEMRRQGVPGAAVALIRDGAVVWEQGFGVQNLLTGEAVRADSVFQVASLGKPVAALGALELAANGKLALSSPMARYLGQPWSNDPKAAAITLRQVLSHTSGLSNSLFPENRSVAFSPGDRFSYSGVGFVYLQAVIEAVTSLSVDGYFNLALFGPLRMTHSGYQPRPDLDSSLVSGHAALLQMVIFFLAPFAAVSAVLSGAATLWMRLTRRRWSFPRAALLPIAGLAVLGVVLLFSGSFAGAYIPTLLATGIGFIGSVLLVTALGRYVLLWSLPNHGIARRNLLIAWIVAAVLAAIGISSKEIVPLTAARPVAGNIAFSLSSTAGDLGIFLSELVAPHRVDPALVALMLTPQIHVADDIEWGLGIGLENDSGVRSIWQWGNNPGFGGFLVGYPDFRTGIVVLANSRGGADLGRAVARRAFGVSTGWKIPD
jgi:CubicO group peptidase (beta-lactamase class C family)